MTTSAESSFTHDHSQNLERNGNSDISAAVSPRTTTEDTQVQHLVTPMILDHDDQGPLTATRVPMEMDKDTNDHLGIHSGSSRSGPVDNYYPTTTSASAYGHTYDATKTRDNMTGTESVGMTSHDGENIKPDIHMLNMYTSTFSNVRTPLQTPQLSNTAMSTPQIDTPEQCLPTFGLGVHIPTTGMDMHFGAQNILNQHAMAGIPHSMPVTTANNLPTNVSPTSQPGSNTDGTTMSTNTSPDFHIGNNHANINMHKLDSFSNMEIPGVTSSSPYTVCSAPTGHEMSGISNEMLAGMDGSISMALDLENGGAVAPNTMALHPFTWA
jgi:hypothetical protein